MPHRGAKRIDEMEAMRGSVGNGKDMRGENGVEEESLRDLKRVVPIASSIENE